MNNPDEKFLNLGMVFDPGAPMQRASQRPGFVALKTGDPIPDTLRAALNVTPVVRDLREIALIKITKSEG